MKKLISIIFIALTLMFISCSRKYTSIQVLQPAQISLPQNIQKVGVVNRSLPDKQHALSNFLEGFLSGEEIFADKDASYECLKGLVNKLNKSPRLGATLIEGANVRGTGTREFPPILDGNVVDNLCKQYNVDALIILEAFDSNTGLTQGKHDEKKKDKNGKEYTETVFNANLDINVNAGWRVYDFQNKNIIDESRFTDRKGWTGKGGNAKDALMNLPKKRDALNQSGWFAGEQYAIRISPTWLTESRSYFAKGAPEFKTAAAYVKSNQMDKAIEFWKKLALNPDKKIAGRACYNMAFACEIKGDFDNALIWIHKSANEFGLGAAKTYSSTIERRIENKKILKQQMGK